MSVAGLIGIVDVTLKYFESLGDWHKDPDGVRAVRDRRDRMVADLEAFDSPPSKAERAELCLTWRANRIDFGEEAAYPPDMFIESVCETIEIS